MVLVVKNLSANAGDLRDDGSIPGSGRSPGERNGNSLQYSCLEKLTDRGGWRATVLHGNHRELDTTKATCIMHALEAKGINTEILHESYDMAKIIQKLWRH